MFSYGRPTRTGVRGNRTPVRAILQHVDNEFNTDLHAGDRDERSRRLFTRFLFSCKLNPRTVLFVGCSDNSRSTQGYGFTQ